MGLPFNSNADDLDFSLGDSLGYLTSNRKESYDGIDDIYTFTKNAKKEASILSVPVDSLIGAESVSISGKVLDADTQEPVDVSNSDVAPQSQQANLSPPEMADEQPSQEASVKPDDMIKDNG